MRVLAAVLAVLTVAAGWAWWSAESPAQHRDEALRAGQRSLAVFNTLDHRRVDEGLRRWLEESAGGLNEEFRRMSAESKDQIRQARTVTEGRVTDAALTELDGNAGTAKLIASVEVAVTPDGGPPATKRNRYQADLLRTPSGWKTTSLTPVPLSAPGP
ncbi:hypothetical protein [Allokutzneria oryzae]|uniref:Mce-associated membrane protein n=1 Tax=Allokutzneria oryzae TaxID=1378989 RepID=A0ABV6A2Z7_9PSEU